MKSKIILVILGSFALARADDTNTSTNSEPALVGRYQLVSGVVTGQPTMFRLDTVTGRVWYHQSTPFPFPVGTNHVDLPVDYWQPISERDYMTQVSNIINGPLYRAAQKR